MPKPCTYFIKKKCVNPFPKRRILDHSKFKAFADDNFELDENGRKISKWLENTVGKGEIARYEQFLLFPQCFQKTCTAEHIKTRACLGKGYLNSSFYVSAATH